MTFSPEGWPFPHWKGPYSPSRGKWSGFRVRNERLGAWSSANGRLSFCPIHETAGVNDLTKLVIRHFKGGGRVLMLPSGHVIKPLQEYEERGKRVFIGRFKGAFKLNVGDERIDLETTGPFAPGDPWPGSGTIGLECTIGGDGSLTTRWQQPSEYGSDLYREKITGPDQRLASGFRKARPHDEVGRVRVTVGGHTITNRKVGEIWKTFYVGRVDPARLENWNRWIERSHHG